MSSYQPESRFSQNPSSQQSATQLDSSEALEEKELPSGRDSRDSPQEEHESVRHSYDYARRPSGPRRVGSTTSRHTSVVTTLSRLRSRNPQSGESEFYHPLTKEKTGKDVVVDFDGKDDPYRPLNWPFRKKAVTTLLYGLTTAGITFASSVYSAGLNEISKEFGVGMEVSTLGITLMLFGFGLGPLIWAPMSELYGRKLAVLTPYFIAVIFSFATGAAKDIQTIMLTRFFAGFFGSASITNTGGVLGDIWSAEQRGMAMVAYAIAVTGGPTIGPVVGGAICQSYLGWRWTQYITGFMMATILFFDVLLLEESFGPVLLVYKARRLRLQGNWALHASHEEWDVSIRELAHKYLIRPFQLLVTPICFAVALYASFVYAILYANLIALPIVFQQNRRWGQVIGTLPFLALFIGICIGAALNILNQKYYFKQYTAAGNRAVPEARLPPMMGGSLFFAGGLWIFAWTSPPDIHWIGPVMGCVSIGIGFFTIFQACLNYLVDTFQKYGASAIAANTFLRSCLAGAFPLFISYELADIGVPWGMSIFAAFATILIPVPYVFFIFGKRIRARSVWSRDSV